MKGLIVLVVMLIAVQGSLAIGLIGPTGNVQGQKHVAKTYTFILRGDGVSRSATFFVQVASGNATIEGSTRPFEQTYTVDAGEKTFDVVIEPTSSTDVVVEWGVRVAGSSGVGLQEVVQRSLTIDVPGGSSGNANATGGSSGTLNVTVTPGSSSGSSSSSSSSSSSRSGGGGGSSGVLGVKNSTTTGGAVPSVTNPPAEEQQPPAVVQDAAGEQGIAQVQTQTDVPAQEDPGATTVTTFSDDGKTLSFSSPESKIAIGIVLLGLVTMFLQVQAIRVWRRENA